ncbi:hypothetical protein CQ044_00050 [Microbacterium sp. MYb64]|nr:hypothetical protein CQ044_00050 [Microbacterium sp. MYb64]
MVDGAIDCRATWALDTDPVGKIKGSSCYLREQTIGITAQLVLRDWAKLEIPSSMSSLVGDTSKLLQGVADIDLKTECGADVVPADTAQCNTALGSRNFLYTALKPQLAAWSPYL